MAAWKIADMQVVGFGAGECASTKVWAKRYRRGKEPSRGRVRSCPHQAGIGIGGTTVVSNLRYALAFAVLVVTLLSVPSITPCWTLRMVASIGMAASFAL